MPLRDRLSTLAHWLLNPRDKTPRELELEERLDRVEARVARVSARQDRLISSTRDAGRALRR